MSLELSISEAAAELNVSRKKVARLVDLGYLDHSIGERSAKLIPQSQIESLSRAFDAVNLGIVPEEIYVLVAAGNSYEKVSDMFKIQQSYIDSLHDLYVFEREQELKPFGRLDELKCVHSYREITSRLKISPENRHLLNELMKETCPLTLEMKRFGNQELFGEYRSFITQNSFWRYLGKPYLQERLYTSRDVAEMFNDNGDEINIARIDDLARTNNIGFKLIPETKMSEYRFSMCDAEKLQNKRC